MPDVGPGLVPTTDGSTFGFGEDGQGCCATSRAATGGGAIQEFRRLRLSNVETLETDPEACPSEGWALQTAPQRE